jgi:hypothetical protein
VVLLVVPLLPHLVLNQPLNKLPRLPLVPPPPLEVPLLVVLQLLLVLLSVLHLKPPLPLKLLVVPHPRLLLLPECKK